MLDKSRTGMKELVNKKGGNSMDFRKITPTSALKRQAWAPTMVVIAPSGSGKSTLVNLLLSDPLARYTKIGVGENSQTTIIPCKFCLDERIADENSCAIQITRKDYTGKDINMAILTALKDLFFKNGCDAEDTLDAFDEEVLFQIIEPKEASYHLEQIKDDISLEDLLKTLSPILNYLVDHDFNANVKARKDQLKSNKIKLSEVREIVFEEMFEDMPNDVKDPYIQWLDQIGEKIYALLEEKIGSDMLAEKVVEYHNLTDNSEGTHVLAALFDPTAPYSLIVDHISLACRPRQELINTVQPNTAQPIFRNLPFRLCIRDTIGLTQKGIDATSTKEALEAALNCMADSILFLLSLEEREDTLTECCRALAEKKNELAKKNHFEPSVYVLFTKADRKVENRINNLNTGSLYISENTYSNHIQSVLKELETTVHSYSTLLPQKEVGWLSLRYVKDSYILKALKNDKRRCNFEPQGLFEKIVDFSMKTLRSILPTGIQNPILVTGKDADKPAIEVVVDPEKVKDKLAYMQHNLCEEPDIVNGYVISDKTPRLHGRSVSTYWCNLIVGLGHTTRASIYGNFSINMKGLLRRMLYRTFASFAILDENSTVQFTAENLDDTVLEELVKILVGKANPEFEKKVIDRASALQYLYRFYTDYFMNESKFASLIDRVAYNLSYGNEKVKKYLTDIYNKNNTIGYDLAMRNLQVSFKKFFGSDDFIKILIFELNQTMSQMVNKSFIVS